MRSLRADGDADVDLADTDDRMHNVGVRLTTWNVLHRIHAVNWKEAPVALFPDERVRSVAIADTVVRWLDGGVDVACLQEVSGDLLARLRDAVGRGVRVFDHLYPRVPRLREPGPPALEDPSEHLVVLVRRSPARLRSATTFENDPGKGLLAVDVGDDVIVIGTHVSYGDRGVSQLDLIGRTARDDDRSAVVLGDFNAPDVEVGAGLGADFTLASVIGPTRIATTEHAGKTIDHVAVRGMRIASATLLDAQGLSDHHPVTVEITKAH